MSVLNVSEKAPRALAALRAGKATQLVELLTDLGRDCWAASDEILAGRSAGPLTDRESHLNAAVLAVAEGCRRHGGCLSANDRQVTGMMPKPFGEAEIAASRHQLMVAVGTLIGWL